MAKTTRTSRAKRDLASLATQEFKQIGLIGTGVVLGKTAMNMVDKATIDPATGQAKPGILTKAAPIALAVSPIIYQMLSKSNKPINQMIKAVLVGAGVIGATQTIKIFLNKDLMEGFSGIPGLKGPIRIGDFFKATPALPGVSNNLPQIPLYSEDQVLSADQYEVVNVDQVF